MIARLRRLVASLLVVSIAGLGLPLPAQAGIVPTGAALRRGFLFRAPAPRFERRREIQRVRRLATPVQAEEVQSQSCTAKVAEHIQRAIHMSSMIAPGANYDCRLARGAQDRSIVAASDRIARRLHLLRIGRAPSEDIGHQ